MEAPSPSQQLVGAVLNGRWKLVRLLGEGGMGAVYEADGARGEGKRAIKMLHPEFIREEMIHQRFLAEAQATRGLSHPNIAPILEAGRAEDGTPYLVMELLQGISLGDYIEQNKNLAQQQVVPIILEILQALAFAHSRRIVHRDLKPDNVFLARDARGAGVVKVLDFGIAKVMDMAGGMGSKTRTGMLLGTPGYMSPEQIKNAKAVDPRSDLYSVATIFYEMLAGQLPFHADNEYARITAVIVGEATPIEQVAPHLGAWGPFFRRALAKEPAERYQYAEEMAQALMAVRGSGVQAAPIPAAFAATQRAFPDIPAADVSRAFAAVQAQQGQPSSRPSAGPAAPAGHALPAYPPQGPSLAVAPPAGASPPVNTHVSGQRLAGTAGVFSTAPDIEVISAPSTLRAGPPWWLAGVIAFVCLGLGFVLGLLVAG
jgi:serine/threonine-protein kinase